MLDWELVTASRRDLIAIVVLAAACIAVFARVIDHGFLTWDDGAFLLDNRWISHPSLENLAAIWSRPILHLYAPLTYTLWSLQSALFGPSAQVFHATNVLLHLASCWIVYVLLSRLLREYQGYAPLAGALFFGLHPVQVETVAWASETKDLLYTLLSLAAMTLYLRYVDGVSVRQAALEELQSEGKKRLKSREEIRIASVLRAAYRDYALASGLFILALLAKPAALVVPLQLVALNRWALGRSWSRSLEGLVPWLSAAAIFALITSALQPAGEQLTFVPDIWLRPLIAADTVGFYLSRLFLPWTVAPDYGRTPQLLISTGALRFTWIAALVLLAACVLFRKKAPLVPCGAALFVIGFLPVSGLVSFDYQQYSTVADHYLYLPMLGAALLFAWAFTRAGTLRLAFFPLLVVLGVLSFHLSSYWKDNATFFARALARNPTSLMAHNSLGQLADEQGKNEEALARYQAAMKIDPAYLRSQLGVANALFKLGRHDAAIQQCRTALAEATEPQAKTTTAGKLHNVLGAALVKKNQPNEGMTEFGRAIETDPHETSSYFNLGSVLLASGKVSQAIEVFEKGLAANPGAPDLLARLREAKAP